jgi:peptidoglycan/LPS O-acetylase OafA/YrhL
VRPRLLGTYSAIPGAIVMFFLAALIVYAWKRSDAPAYGLPDVGVALIAAVCSAACYLVALGRALLRGHRAQLASA